jgi:hypothetical protein
MVNDIMGLMAETIEEQIGEDAVCFKPSNEDYRFAVAAAGSVFLVNPSEKTFTPVKRGDASRYLDVKRFLKQVSLKYVRA